MSRENKNQQKPEKKYVFDNLRIIFSGIIVVVGLLYELYTMINDPGNITMIAIFAVVILLAIYFLIASTLRIIRKKDEERDEHYENMIKSEKASYLLMRKYFAELEDHVYQLGENFDAATKEIISAQKSVAKISITRGRENADAIMSQLEAISTQNNESKDKLIEIRQNVMDGLNDVEGSLKDSMLQVGHNVSFVQPQMVVTQPQEAAPAPVSEPEPVVEAEVAEEILAAPEPVVEAVAEPETLVEAAPAPEPEPVVEAVPEPEPESVVEAAPEPEPEPVVESVAEPEPEPEPAPAVEAPSDDPNHVMTPEEIAALVAGSTSEPEPTPEPAPAVEAPSDDPNHVMTPEEIAALVAGAADEPAPDEPMTTEKAQDIIEDAPLDDPNHVMTPEEIAALVAGAADGNEAAPAPEPEPAPAAAPAPDIDLSDPNHVMTPDEIAALLASM